MHNPGRLTQSSKSLQFKIRQKATRWFDVKFNARRDTSVTKQTLDESSPKLHHDAACTPF